MKVHEDKKYACHLCKRTFSRSATLNSHLKTHESMNNGEIDQADLNVEEKYNENEEEEEDPDIEEDEEEEADVEEEEVEEEDDVSEFDNEIENEINTKKEIDIQKDIDSEAITKYETEINNAIN